VKLFPSQGSADVGGDNSGLVLNTNAADGSSVNIQVNAQHYKRLPSYLGKFIVQFSQQELAAYAKGSRRDVPPEVLVKIEYNHLDEECQLLRVYRRFLSLLESSYAGVEKYNADARYLVRLKTASAYDDALLALCKSESIAIDRKHEFARSRSEELVQKVVSSLLDAYTASDERAVEQETALLAVFLLVADAFVECEVLERPQNAAAA